MNTDFMSIEVLSERSFAGTPDAVAAARAGEIKRLDALELAWRNSWRVLPDVPRWMPGTGDGLELFAIELERHYGPRCISIIRWALVHPCPRCWRQLMKRKDCRRCHGYGYTDHNGDWNDGELPFEFYADLDGRIVEIER